MRFFTNKTFWFKLIMTMVLSLILFTFITTNVADAAEYNTGKSDSIIGGALLEPIIDFLLGIGDAIINIVQKTIMGTEASIAFDTAGKIFSAILAAGICIVVLVGLSLTGVGALFAAPVFGSLVAGAVGIATFGVFALSYNTISGALLDEPTVIPTYSISPEEIFRGEVLLFDVNIFNPKDVYVCAYLPGEQGTLDDSYMSNVKADQGTEYTGSTRIEYKERKEKIPLKEWQGTTGENDSDNGYANWKVEYYYYYKDGNPNNNSDDNKIITSANNAAYELKNTVAKWYYALRNISVVVLMVILVYMGIRMVTSSLASDKAKYKQMMADWAVAMCLVFVMQYIMVFANNFTESLVDLLSSVADTKLYTEIVKDPNPKLIEGMKEAGLEQFISQNDVSNKEEVVLTTNLMGKARMLSQVRDGTTTYIGYSLCFIVLVIYTIIFMIVYAKRLLWVVFLTVISPLIAISYPIDKIGDGKSQAFDMWLKEYIFNLIIQPFHLLLYVVFVSSAFELAGTNIIYTLIVMGFMMPAEKFLRTMFGFDKAHTPGFLGGAAGAAVAMSAISKLGSIAGKGSAKAIPGKNNVKEVGQDNKVKLNGKSSAELEKDFLKGSDNEANNERSTGNRPPRDNENIYEGGILGAQRGNTDEELGERRRVDELEGMNSNEGSEINPQTPIRMQEEPVPNSEMDDTSIDNRAQGVKPRMSYGQAMLSRAGKNLKNHVGINGIKRDAGKILSSSTRNATKLAMGITGATAGLAAGITAGDLKSVGRDVIAGGYAGSSIGSGISNSVANAGRATYDKIQDERVETRKEQYGTEYSKYLLEQEIKKSKKDPEVKEILTQELGLDKKSETYEEDLKRAMKDYEVYQRAAIFDPKLAAKSMKLARNPNDRASAEQVYAAKLSQHIKSPKDLKEKKQDLMAKAGNSKEQRARIDRLMENISKINKDTIY